MAITASKAREIATATETELIKAISIVAEQVLNGLIEYAITQAATDGEYETSVHLDRVISDKGLEGKSERWFRTYVFHTLRERGFKVETDAMGVTHIRW